MMLFRFACRLLWEADCFEVSIPVYFAAASLLKKERDMWPLLLKMSYCVGFKPISGRPKGMYWASKWLIRRDATMKEVVKRHVIPLMHDVKNQMLEVTSVSEEDKCRWMNQVLGKIAKSEELVDDDEAAEEAWKECDVWEERRKREEERTRREEKRNEPWWKKIRDVL